MGFIDVIILFVTQVVFIWARTVNVKAVAEGDLVKALISGAVVHWAWLVSIAIGAISMSAIIDSIVEAVFGSSRGTDITIYHYLAVLASTAGGLTGTAVGMREKRKKGIQKLHGIPKPQSKIKFK